MSSPAPLPTNEEFAIRRSEMVQRQLLGRGLPPGPVLRAMENMPRHAFVNPDHSPRAYHDAALPSTDGQTISQPYIVAYMTLLLNLQPRHRVLEIGTGTGYQTALLATLASEVFTIERIPALAEAAQKRLASLGINNVHYHVGDGSLGWPGQVESLKDSGQSETLVLSPESFNLSPPFDRIIVTAASPTVPAPLKFQLADGGILLLPLGTAEAQTLTTVTRHGHSFITHPYLDCRFVPLLGQHAWSQTDWLLQAP